MSDRPFERYRPKRDLLDHRTDDQRALALRIDQVWRPILTLPLDLIVYCMFRCIILAVLTGLLLH